MVPPKKRLSLANDTPQNDSPKPAGEGVTPRTTRRRSVVAEEINATATPSTPTRRGRRLSEVALTEDNNDNGAGVATPTRRSRRVSGSLADDLPTVAVNTPTRRSRRTSGAGLDTVVDSPAPLGDTLRRTRRTSGAGLDAVDSPAPLGDTLRRTRRTSGAGLDAVDSPAPLGDTLRRTRRTSGAGLDAVDSPAPLGDTLRRTRRTSGTFTDINTDSPNAGSLKRSAPSDSDSNLATANKTPAKRGRRKSITNLEEVVEENEEAVTNTLDVIKEDEEEKTDVDTKKENEKIEEKENAIIDIEDNKKEKNTEKENETVNALNEDKEVINVEDKPILSKETVSVESPNKKVKLSNEEKENIEAEKVPQTLIEENIEIKTKDLENKPVESEKMEVSESKAEDVSDTNVLSVAKSDDNSQKNNIPMNSNKIVFYKKTENNNMEKKVIPRGIPKSGRFWKTEKKRFSSINVVKPLKSTWAKKMQLKDQRKSFMAESHAIKEEKRLKTEALRERQALNKEMKDKNAKKAEVVQVIKDPRKIKKMKRKQLRYIETRDTSQPAKVL